jgi:hypothetical protein
MKIMEFSIFAFMQLLYWASKKKNKKKEKAAVVFLACF